MATPLVTLRHDELEECFTSEIQMRSVENKILDWVRKHFDPDMIYDHTVLAKWANENGYTREDSFNADL